jgi:glucuronate isomerase
VATWNLPEDRCFDPDPATRRAALNLYHSIQNLPIISPHGHVDAALFADPHASFGTPADLLVIPDHYVFRMIHSQGVPLASLGVPSMDGTPVERDHRRIWQRFADHFYLFRGTPSGLWLAYEFKFVLGIEEQLTPQNAARIYDQIVERLASPEFRPRALFEKFNIEVLATTDSASDPLDSHRALRASGWAGRVIPTFRPDAVVNLETENWHTQIEALSRASGVSIRDYASFLAALETRRAAFRQLGAVATDHGVFQPQTAPLPEEEAHAIFQRALQGQLRPGDASRFTAHMLMEMARMSCEDGLVMQLHCGSFRNHHPDTLARFGRDRGYDIPVQTEFTHNLRPLLARYGADPRLTLILFTLDETTYARELAPLAGVYPALRLGPPWWFHDSWNGMRRYFDQVMETAGIYNTVGFNDDTRAFLSIPARHDLWRRAVANWLAGLLVRGFIGNDDALEMARELAYHLPRRAYRLDQTASALD